MAVTKIWPVKGRLDAVIRYAGNEEKTRLPDLTGLSAGKDDLSDVLQYAANDAKTTRESQLTRDLVYCVPEIARQQMELTKQQFGKTAVRWPSMPTRASALMKSRRNSATPSGWNWPNGCGVIGFRYWWPPT